MPERVHLMCLVSAFLQSHVCQAVEFLQGNEMNAALSASLLDLYILGCIKQKVSSTQSHCPTRKHGKRETHSVFRAAGFQLLDFRHEFGESGTGVLVQHVVLLRVSALQLHLLIIHTHLLRDTHTQWPESTHRHSPAYQLNMICEPTLPNHLLYNGMKLQNCEIWPSSPESATEKVSTAEQDPKLHTNGGWIEKVSLAVIITTLWKYLILGRSNWII